MDLVQTVRKEGSRGGRGDFKWEDVKNDAHRESYLGHSLMAPVGRWQQNRDLSWYSRSRSGNADDANAAAAARKAEFAAVKAAEEDAMAAALGLPVAPRNTTGANAEPLPEGEARKVIATAERAAGVTEEWEGEGDRERGIGYGGFGGATGKAAGDDDEVLAGTTAIDRRRRGGRDVEDHRDDAGRREYRRRRRSRSREDVRDRSRERRRERHRDRSEGRERRKRRHRSRSTSPRGGRDRNHRRRETRERSRSRSRSRTRHHDRHNREERRQRRRSPSREREADRQARTRRGRNPDERADRGEESMR